MTENRIYSVTLAFTPPGPLHTSILIAPDEASASAMAMQAALSGLPIETPVMTVLAVPVDPDVLRRMLRAIEGKGPGEVVSLVRPEQRAAEILRQHPETDAPVPDLSWARQPGTLDALNGLPCRENEHEWVDETCVRCGSFLVPMPEPAA